MPCGACREFLTQLSLKNKDMEIMIDYKRRENVRLDKNQIIFLEADYEKS